MTCSVIHTIYYTLKGENWQYNHVRQFEEGNLLSEYRNGTESINEYDDDSTLPPLISEAEIYARSSGNESDDEPISMDMLEDIRDVSQSHPRINRREARNKIWDRVQKRCA